MTLFDLIIGNSVFQIECIKMFVNTARGRLEPIVYDQLIKNKRRRHYKGKTVLPFTVYRTMKVMHAASTVVSVCHWLCIAGFIANSSNVSTRGNEHEQRNCIMYNVLMQSTLTGWTVAVSNCSISVKILS